MRHVINPQMLLDGVNIGAIYLDPKSRDDIPQLLCGLQHIYTEPWLRERVFTIRHEVIPNRAKGEGKAHANMGRPGMEQWRILVLGLDEFVFRFNRRSSRFRGMLFYLLMEQAAVTAPVTYCDIRDNRPGRRRHQKLAAPAERSG